VRAPHPSESRRGRERSLLLEGLRETLPAGLKAMAPCLIAAVVVTVVIIYLARGVIPLIQELMTVGRFGVLLLPLILAVVYGAILGFGSGHRLTEKGGMVGWAACALGSTIVIATFVSGRLAGEFFVEGGVLPLLHFWLIAVSFTAMIGISYFTLWAK